MYQLDTDLNKLARQAQEILEHLAKLDDELLIVNIPLDVYKWTALLATCMRFGLVYVGTKPRENHPDEVTVMFRHLAQHWVGMMAELQTRQEQIATAMREKELATITGSLQ